MKTETIIMSVGGSMVYPGKVNSVFLKKLRKLVLKHKEKKFIFIVGGGTTARDYIGGAVKIVRLSHEEQDWIGIAATKLNAELVMRVFGKLAHKKVVNNPTLKIRFSERVLVASGWKPGFSTDTDAVLLAKNFGVKRVINLTNIDYAYNKDPRKFKNAKKLVDVSWSEFRKIVGDKWIPGMNAPFDPIASKLGEKLGLIVGILKGNNLKNVDKFISGKKYQGTTIHPHL